MQASGDTKGYQVEWERVQEHKTTIQKLEREIDSHGNKKMELKKYHARGRKAMAEDVS